MNKTPAIDDRSVAGQDGDRAPAFPRSAFREMEAALSNPLFFGIPLGATLNDCFVTAFVDGLRGLATEDEVAEALAVSPASDRAEDPSKHGSHLRSGARPRDLERPQPPT